MLQHKTDLQSAVDIVTKMLAQRVAEYADLKRRLPSFGPEIDGELARYLTALEHYTQGTVVWYYDSPRTQFRLYCAQPLLTRFVGYFRGVDLSDKHNLIIPVYPPSTSAPRPWAVSSKYTVEKFLPRVPPVVRLLIAFVAIVSLLLWHVLVPSASLFHVALVSP